jgi:hypothetical protein
MTDLIQVVLSKELLPHGQCLLWESGLVWLHVTSDLLIAAAYFSIPATLGYLTFKKQNIEFRWMFLLFAAFIVACGMTHLMNIWTLWQPVYWLEGFMKMLTAGLSVATACLLVPLVPKALRMPSPSDLEMANRKLQREVTDRELAEEALVHRASELARANAELERFNRGATVREQRMIELKRQVNALLQASGKPAAYDLAFAQSEPTNPRS